MTSKERQQVMRDALAELNFVPVVKRRDQGAGVRFVVMGWDGGYVVLDILEPKRRYLSRVWRSAVRTEGATHILVENIATGCVSRRVRLRSPEGPIYDANRLETKSADVRRQEAQ